MARNCIVVNLDRCTGCFGCEVACKMENGVALGERWSKVFTVGPVGEYPDMTRYALPTMCQQCENAPCVSVCPTGASYRDGNNVVLVDKEKCIGCKYCMMACPYGVRSWNAAEKCAEKCTLCGHLTSKYSEGDIHTLQDVGNHPATRYIMTSMIGQWQDRIAPADHPHTAAYPVAE